MELNQQQQQQQEAELTNLLNNILTEEALNTQIKTSKSLETLNLLLDIKQIRITNGKSEKISFPIQHIYCNQKNYNLACKVLVKSLLILEDSDKHLIEVISYLNNLINENQIDKPLFELLNVLLDYSITDNKEQTFVENLNLSLFNQLLLSILGSDNKLLIIIIIVDIIPKCLNCKLLANKSLISLENLFNFIKESKKLDILCSLYKFFITSDVNEEKYNLLKVDDFWILLQECLFTNNNCLIKQTSFILAKSINTTFNVPIDCRKLLSKFIKIPIDQEELKQIWRNYLILLDVSNEKQLHLIEPTLPLLNSIKALHHSWQICLYKILLNHSQCLVVYSVARHIFQFVTYEIFPELIDCLFIAINRSEYSTDSRKMFKEFTKLTKNEHQLLLDESINKLSWNPIIVWNFYKIIFNNNYCNLTLALFEKLINKIKTLPDIYIREGTIDVCLNYFLINYQINDSLDDFLKIVQLLLQVNNERKLVGFIETNQKKILCFVTEMDKKLNDIICVDETDWKLLENLIYVYKLLEIEPTVLQNNSKQLTVLSDFIYLNSTQQNQLNRTDLLENYLESRLKQIKNDENISYFLSLLDCLKNTCINSKLFVESLNILKNYSNYNKQQIIIAFKIIKNCGDSDMEIIKSIINDWKLKFIQNKEKLDEEISLTFLDIYFKYYYIICDKEIITISNNILDLQNDQLTIKILGSLSLIINNSTNITNLFNFINNCFTEIRKSKKFKQLLQMFIREIYQAKHLNKKEFSENLLKLTKKLLNLSDTFTFIACILSEKLSKLSLENPKEIKNFIPIIVELILHGIVLRKDVNPNLEVLLIRLKAFDSILNLIDCKQLEFIADDFTSLLIERYKIHFNKRYFPDSQVHLEKLRICQAWLLIHRHIVKEKTNLINLIVESFLNKSHQTSIKHLMQWLLINLLKSDINSAIELIREQLTRININKISSIAAFIPVLYNLIIDKEEEYWLKVFKVFLPYTMGPQFKLRILSQVAIVRLFEKAKEKNYQQFLRYEIFYNSLKIVIAEEIINFKKDFLDYFNTNDCNPTLIFYYIPKINHVTLIEWENLPLVNNKLTKLNFNAISIDDYYLNNETNKVASSQICLTKPTENIQKKINPWRDFLNETNQTQNNFILITTLIEKSANLGGLSRTCEVFGVKQMVMRTAKIIGDKEFKSLSMSSENWVDIIEVKLEDLKTFILSIKQKDYSVIGAEQTVESVTLNKYKFPENTALLLGNEKEGIPADLLPLLDTCVEIPQFGVIRSLNVHVAGAIFIWEYCKQHLTLK